MTENENVNVVGPNNTEAPTGIRENPTVEEIAPNKEPDEAPKGLSRREALEVAIEAHKEPSEAKSVSRQTEDRSFGDRVKPTKVAKEKPNKTTFEAPGEWTKEEHEDFKIISDKQREATLRLYKSGRRTLDEIKREREEAKRDVAEREWVKELEREVTPLLRAKGETEPTHKLIINALKLRNEWEKGDPRAVAAAYLQARGIRAPKELLESAGVQNAQSNEQIGALQKEIDALKMGKAEEQRNQYFSTMVETHRSLSSATNAKGGLKYPDLTRNDEEGLKLANQIGTLVNGMNEQSKAFISLTRSRIPDLDAAKLYDAAYKFLGGRVDDISEAPKSQESQTQHIANSRRAAASVPGRGAHSASNGVIKKFKTRREALESAFHAMKERESA